MDQGKSSAEVSVFKKLPLDPTKKEIRVLQLFDGEGIVHCRLQKVSLLAWTPEYKSFYAACEHDDEQLSTTEYLAAKVTEKWVASHTRECEQGHAACGPLVVPRSRLLHEKMDWGSFKRGLNLSPGLKAPSWSSFMAMFQRPYGNDNNDMLMLAYEADEAEQTLADNFCCPPRFAWGDFEALSYCWGSGERVCSLVVNGIEIKISQNLDAALREVRKLPEVRAGMHIWCDALCINQQDDDERNHQVSLMGHIFRHTFSVVAWLGPSSPETNKVVDNLAQQHFAQVYGRYQDGCALFDRNQFGASDCMELYALFSRPYWSRLWVMQELILNENLTVFLVGDRLIPRSLLYRYVAAEQTENAAVVAYNVNQMRRLTGLPPELCRLTQAEVLATLRRVEFLCRSSECGYLLRQNLIMILEASQSSECKEPVDKIYGLLGLLPSDLRCTPDYTIPVAQVYEQFAHLLHQSKGLTGLLSWSDYHPSLRAATWVPNWTRTFPRNHLQLLAKKAAGGSITERASTITSDGNRICCTVITMDSIKDLSSASRYGLPFFSDHPADVHGWTTIRIDPEQNRYGGRTEVAMALERTVLMDHPELRTRQPLHEEHQSETSTTIIGNIYWINWKYLESIAPSPYSESDFSHSFWDTMSAVVWSSMSADRRGPPSHFYDFDRFRQSNATFSVFGIPFHSLFPGMKLHWKHMMTPKPDPYYFPLMNSNLNDVVGGSTQSTDSQPQRPDQLTSDDLHNVRLAAESVKGRRLMTTESGYLGLVPDEAWPGDQVAVLRGCNFPVVLRAVNRKDDQGVPIQAYQYIGECYVDGLMNGECLSENDACEKQQQQPTQIYLV